MPSCWKTRFDARFNFFVNMAEGTGYGERSAWVGL